MSNTVTQLEEKERVLQLNLRSETKGLFTRISESWSFLKGLIDQILEWCMDKIPRFFHFLRDKLIALNIFNESAITVACGALEFIVDIFITAITTTIKIFMHDSYWDNFKQIIVKEWNETKNMTAISRVVHMSRTIGFAFMTLFLRVVTEKTKKMGAEVKNKEAISKLTSEIDMDMFM